MFFRNRFLVLIASGILTVVSPAAKAWGPIGHRIVGEIAERFLEESSKKQIQELLGDDSLAEVSTWADLVRSDPKHKDAAPWHFVSIEDGETYNSSKKNPKGDVVWAIENFSRVLCNKGSLRAEKIEALKFLVHFVGDVHMPLHVGRKRDQGGNLFRVKWLGRPTNLHDVWDNGMLDSEKLSYTEKVAFLLPISKEKIEEWQKSTVQIWARESYDVRASLYPSRPGAALGYDYYFEHYELMNRRLRQAGVRLAGLLQSCFQPK